PLIGNDQLMEAALLEMTTKGFGCVGITDTDGKLIGIITDGDLRRHMGSDLLTKKAGDVMTRRPQTITPDSLAAKALSQMNSTGNNGITCLFVSDGEMPLGILSVHDCLRAGVM
ncbi:MAG: CBS domain-containing protein, partial [Sneathiella sp.]|nr:CBS domain-containing protein [Sneathiella sp.]